MNRNSNALDWARRKIGMPLRNIASRCIAPVKWAPYQVISFAQEGEDIILGRIFGSQTTGFYVDVGAHHPQRFSNTYLFYRRGWRGINIDAMPGGMEQFDRVRPRDINLEIPVMRQRARLKYYQFNEPALNGFDAELSAARTDSQEYRIVRTIDLEGKPLRDILTEHLPPNTDIDFLTIDVEGLDQDVVESNDWSRFRPKVVLVEALNCSFSNASSHPICQLMQNNRYELYAKTVYTIFFMSKEFSYQRTGQ